jgi:excisionase family DNA binding protein
MPKGVTSVLTHHLTHLIRLLFTMNKQDAAKYLNISVRTLQRLTTDGKISVGEVRGRTGMVTDYTTDDLDHYKKAEAEREANPRAKDATRYVRPHVIPPDTALTSSSEALQRAGSEQGIAMLVSMLSEAANAPHATCMLLSVKEAASFSGLSASRIMKAIHDKELDGRKIGRGFKVRPADVREYVRQVFDEAERHRKADKAEQGKIGARTMKA